jgi:hypothetical protein
MRGNSKLPRACAFPRQRPARRLPSTSWTQSPWPWVRPRARSRRGAAGPYRPIPSVLRCGPGLARCRLSASTGAQSQIHPRGRASRSQHAPSTRTISSATPFSSSPREGMATASGVSTSPVLQLPSLRPRRSTVSRVRALVPRINARYMFALAPVKCLTGVNCCCAGAGQELAAAEFSGWRHGRYISACVNISTEDWSHLAVDSWVTFFIEM